MSPVGDLTARLAERADRIWDARLTRMQLAQVEQYLRLLAEWNRTINLTGLPLEGFPDASLDRLAGEPLVAARHVQDWGGTWFDLGSGGGSPGIPIKIARPSLALTLVESRSRKAAFLSEVVRRLDLKRAAVLAERFEQLDAAMAGTGDLVTVRAVRVDHDLLTVVEALLRPGGTLMLFTSPAAQSVLSMAELDSRFGETQTVSLPGPDAVLQIWERRKTNA